MPFSFEPFHPHISYCMFPPFQKLWYVLIRPFLFSPEVFFVPSSYVLLSNVLFWSLLRHLHRPFCRLKFQYYSGTEHFQPYYPKSVCFMLSYLWKLQLAFNSPIARKMPGGVQSCASDVHSRPAKQIVATCFCVVNDSLEVCSLSPIFSPSAVCVNRQLPCRAAARVFPQEGATPAGIARLVYYSETSLFSCCGRHLDWRQRLFAGG